MLNIIQLFMIFCKTCILFFYIYQTKRLDGFGVKVAVVASRDGDLLQYGTQDGLAWLDGNPAILRSFLMVEPGERFFKRVHDNATRIQENTHFYCCVAIGWISSWLLGEAYMHHQNGSPSFLILVCRLISASTIVDLSIEPLPTLGAHFIEFENRNFSV